MQMCPRAVPAFISFELPDLLMMKKQLMLGRMGANYS